MAATYLFACVDCRQYLSVGRVHWVSEDGTPLGEVTFDGVYDPDSRSWRKRDALFGRTVEGFLIRHRNHELRLVPEGVDELLEGDGGAFEALDPADVISAIDVDGIDPEMELKAWQRELGQ